MHKAYVDCSTVGCTVWRMYTTMDTTMGTNAMQLVHEHMLAVTP